MSDPDSLQPAVVVTPGVLKARRQAMVDAAIAARKRSREISSAHLADRFISVPLALLGWVGQVREQHRWVCQVADPDTLRPCGTVGLADSEAEAVAGLTIHIYHEHGGRPE